MHSLFAYPKTQWIVVNPEFLGTNSYAPQLFLVQRTCEQVIQDQGLKRLLQILFLLLGACVGASIDYMLILRA